MRTDDLIAQSKHASARNRAILEVTRRRIANNRRQLNPYWGFSGGADGPANVDGGPRILVVEDDLVLQELIVDVVQEAGYFTNRAANGLEALRHLATHRYDLILCDLLMPAMDGPAFYREARRRFPEAAPRIVFMTGHVSADEFLPFLNEVGAPVLQKPFSIQGLRATVAQILGSPSPRPRPCRPAR